MHTNCPACFNAPAILNPQFGLLPCLECKKRLDHLPQPKESVEIISENIKAERQERGDSIEQPHVKGELNKKWVDLWGEQAARERGFSEREIKSAKYVYDGLRTKNSAVRFYKDRT